MERLIQDFIPDTIDTLLERWEGEGTEQYRLTLLHKNNDNIYCFLSGNLQEIKPEQKIDRGMTISLSKKNRIESHYDLIFHRKEVNERYYFTLEKESFYKKKTKVLPFGFESEPPSIIVNRDLKEKLIDYIEKRSGRTLNVLEYIGNNNLLKAIFHIRHREKWKEEKEKIKEVEKSFRKDITELFKEEPSPSLFIRRGQYLPEDISKEVLFVKGRNSLKYVLLIPGLAIMPVSFPDVFLRPLNAKYEQKFLKTKEEEYKFLISEFALAHPKLIKGVQRIFEGFKHVSNLSVYTASLGITVLSHLYTPPVISYPLITLNSASALTMLTNLIRSKGRDSSGIISSLLERKLVEKLE